MITIQNGNDANIEVAVSKIGRKLAVVALHYFEVALYQVQTFQNGVCFVQTGFGKQ